MKGFTRFDELSLKQQKTVAGRVARTARTSGKQGVMPKQLMQGEIPVAGVAGRCENLRQRMGQHLIGQTSSLDKITPFVQMHQAGLSPEGRPAGIFLLLGPTGSGKTKTPEVLAKLLHGSEKSLLRIDCGEFQLDHEVAKLVGAPPGYLGHRETKPLITQLSLTAVTSTGCGLSILLLDEIEKASSSMQRILLGVLDKASLRLGDNTTVDLSNTMIFMTSNLGANEMQERGRGYGLSQTAAGAVALDGKDLEAIGLRALKRKFSPEFVNRIDATLVYETLTREHMTRILDLELDALHLLLENRLMGNGFSLQISAEACKWLIDNGFSPEYGARNLKRLIHREILHPAALAFIEKKFTPGALVAVNVDGNHLSLQ